MSEFDRMVSLPDGQTPRFPNRCLRCQSPNPESSAKFRIGFLGTPQAIPACGRCAKIIRRRQLCRAVLFTLGAIAVPILCFHGLEMAKNDGLKGPNGGIGIGVMILSFFPIIGYAFIFPLPVWLSANADRSVTYKWRTDEAAAEFKALNGVR
jgi:hypothetical protein